ncbi:MAG TPA: sialidase family protein [Bryobacteraceae bacterium]|nr:sialidase family protein [Bryobacteraceae bacterium]
MNTHSIRRKSFLALLGAGLLIWIFSIGRSFDLQAQPPDASVASRLSVPVPLSGDFTIRNLNWDTSLGASYPRVIELQHYASGSGQILATYARRGALPIYRSTDGGDTFQFFSEIQNLRGQPALYELPVKMGEFPAGTILAAGQEESADRSKVSLGCDYSSDGGKTWQFLSTFAVGGPGRYDPNDRAGISLQQNPVFEPYLYADAAGRLVVYFSDERDKKDGYSQLLDHRVSSDGGRTWGDLVYDVAIPDGLTRPGMAVVTRAGNGTFYMVYEMVGLPGHALEPRSNLDYFRTSSDGDQWGDPKQYGTLIQDRWRQFPWATPYMVWSPWPAPNGTLLVTGRAMLRYDLGQVGNGMMINRKNGEGLWTLLETPIRYTPNPSGYSQTMIPLGDGREILQMVPVDGRIQYAKFKLPETDKLPVYQFPWDK